MTPVPPLRSRVSTQKKTSSDPGPRPWPGCPGEGLRGAPLGDIWAREHSQEQLQPWEPEGAGAIRAALPSVPRGHSCPRSEPPSEEGRKPERTRDAKDAATIRDNDRRTRSPGERCHLANSRGNPDQWAALRPRSPRGRTTAGAAAPGTAEHGPPPATATPSLGAPGTPTVLLTAAFAVRATSQKPLRQPPAAEWGDKFTGHTPQHRTGTHGSGRQPRRPTRTDQVDQGSQALKAHAASGWRDVCRAAPLHREV